MEPSSANGDHADDYIPSKRQKSHGLLGRSLKEGISSMRKAFILPSRNKSTTGLLAKNLLISQKNLTSTTRAIGQDQLAVGSTPNTSTSVSSIARIRPLEDFPRDESIVTHPSGESPPKQSDVNMAISDKGSPEQVALSEVSPKPPLGERSLVFGDNKIAIAVDISSSTRGRVILEELSAVDAISKGLNPVATLLAQVLPWDEYTRPSLPLDQAGTLTYGLGTRPSSLLRDEFSESTSTLKSCSLWFLLTDGEISQREVHRFASSLSAQGIHGKPCVLIVFGYRPSRPNACQTSVGVSVFAIAPDCIFLFHDVEGKGIYVLQYKGCFGSLIPNDSKEIFLDDESTWESLPRIAYSDLFQLIIPIPDPLAKDEMILQSRCRINLDDLYNDRLHPDQIEEIFRNDEDLKSLLLTTITRGQGAHMRSWIANQQDRMEDLLTCPRPDVGGRASALVQKLLNLSDETNNDDENLQLAIEMRAGLRQAHHDNWSAFTGLIRLRQVKAEKRQVQVRKVSRKFAQVEGDAVSTARSIGTMSVREVDREDEPSAIAAETKAQYDDTVSGLLYSVGYRNTRFLNRVSGRCSLCKGYGKDLALLLREPPHGSFTEGFPQAGSQAKVLFPLSMGNYRETDVISRTVCCDPCSVFVVKHGSSVKGETIIAALPLLPWFDGKTNEESWFRTINIAFQRRFDRSDAPLVFLAVLYDALDQISGFDMTENMIFVRTIQWACSAVARHVEIPFSLDDLHKTGSVHDVVTHHSHNVSSSSGSLLRYPLDSFVLLIRVAFPEEPLETASIATLRPNDNITNLLFRRLLLHIFEQHTLFQALEGEPKAFDSLSATIKRSALLLEQSSQSRTAPPFSRAEASVPLPTEILSVLNETHLLDAEALSRFRRLGYLFSRIEWSFGPAIGLFLVKLVHHDLHGSEPLFLYDRLTRDPEVGKIFSAAQDISVADFLREVNKD